jgi:hypothetical protein
MITTLDAMRRLLSLQWVRRGIIGAAMAALGLFTGCSAVRLAYNQGPSLAYWWLDGYLDFDGAQSLRVRDGLRQWFEWHQQTQLPVYATLLEQLRAEAAGPVTAAQVCRWNDTIQGLVDPALAHILPVAGDVAASLRPEQLAHLDTKFARVTADLRKRMLQADPAERQQAMMERTLKRFEDFYGTLDEPQRRIVEERVRASPYDAGSWFALREQRHRELMDRLRQIVQQQPATTVVRERLDKAARRYTGQAPVAQAAEAARLTAYNCEFVARVHNATTPAQRRQLLDRLKGWEDDVRSLARNAPGGSTGAAAAGPVVTRVGAAWSADRFPVLEPVARGSVR